MRKDGQHRRPSEQLRQGAHLGQVARVAIAEAMVDVVVDQHALGDGHGPLDGV